MTERSDGTSHTLTIPPLWFDLVEERIHPKSVWLSWDLGREVIRLGTSYRLVAHLWVYDSTTHREFSAILNQELRGDGQSVSGGSFPFVALLRERRERFGTKRFRDFAARALAELERRLGEPEVLEVFNPNTVEDLS